MIMLLIFTLAESYIVSSVCSFYEPTSVLLAAGVTAFATIGITIYAICTKS
jgi:FtsH-binding integral membrane protein